MPEKLELGAHAVLLEEIEGIGRQRYTLSIPGGVMERIKNSRRVVDELLIDTDKTHYAINTGFGSLKDVRIPPDQLSTLQVNLIRSHAVGVGPLLEHSTVRALLFLRAGTLALGYSGVRPVVVETLVQMINSDVLPAVPSQGSVGASGDLAPLAHVALAMMGEGKALYKGRVVSASDALADAGIEPLSPGPKEAMALLNGTQMMTAVGAQNVLRAQNVLKNFDISAAMTLEATLGSIKASDPRVHKVRGHAGQALVAENLVRLCAGSEIIKSHESCERVQDAYSIRCAPQVNGAARDALAYVEHVVTTEMNSVTDNPLVFSEEHEIVSAGNFHGQPVSIAMDTLALAMTSPASMSERRTFRLLDPKLSELPAGLVKNPGLNSGLMMLQVMSASLLNECKVLCHPASIDSIPTWADQEDHVSMGAHAARKAEQVLGFVEHIVSNEMICAAQGLCLRIPLQPGRGVVAAKQAIRERFPYLEKDQYMGNDVQALTEAVRRGEIIRAVEVEIDELV